MTIEKLAIKHVEQIEKIERQCFSNPWSYLSIQSEIDNENSVFIVALDNETVTAYAGMHVTYGEYYINNIAVKPEYRKKGIATRLLEILIDIVSECKGEFITLEVRKSNESAIKLYEKMSFKVEGTRKNYYEKPTEDALIMTRREF